MGAPGKGADHPVRMMPRPPSDASLDECRWMRRLEPGGTAWQRAQRHDRCGTERDPERSRPIAVSADRRVRVSVGLPYRGVGRARWSDRLAVRAELRLAERGRELAGGR